MLRCRIGASIRTAGQHAQQVTGAGGAEPGQQRQGRQLNGARGRQFDGEGNSAQQAADGEDGVVLARIGKVAADRQRPLPEHLDSGTVRGEAQPGQRHHMLVAQGEASSAGHHQHQVGRLLPGFPDDSRGFDRVIGAEQSVEGVQHQYGGAPAVPVAIDRTPGVRASGVDRVRHGEHQVGAVGVRQLGEDRLLAQLSRHLDRQPGLADAAGPGDRHQVGTAADQRHQRSDLRLAAEQGCPGRRNGVLVAEPSDWGW